MGQTTKGILLNLLHIHFNLLFYHFSIYKYSVNDCVCVCMCACVRSYQNLNCLVS